MDLTRLTQNGDLARSPRGRWPVASPSTSVLLGNARPLLGACAASASRTRNRCPAPSGSSTGCGRRSTSTIGSRCFTATTTATGVRGRDSPRWCRSVSTAACRPSLSRTSTITLRPGDAGTPPRPASSSDRRHRGTDERRHRLRTATARSAIELVPRFEFYMSGIGYGHPQWGHGRNRGELAVGFDVRAPRRRRSQRPAASPRAGGVRRAPRARRRRRAPRPGRARAAHPRPPRAVRSRD